jgi:CheY-like chemotaxis protein
MCRVLIVDDESLVLSLLKRVLNNAGFDTIEAQSGHEALAILGDNGTRIDLLVTDLKMPGMSGQELAGKALELRPELPVLYMSGYCDRAAAGADALKGSSGFLQKPFSRASLLAKIFTVLPEGAWPGLTQAVNS